MIVVQVLFLFYKSSSGCNITQIFSYTPSMIPTITYVFPRPVMVLSRSKANSDAHVFCINWLLCKLWFRRFFPFPNTPTHSSTPPLWSPSILVCFLGVPWYYPHLRPTREQTDFVLFDCCVIIFFVVFSFSKHTHMLIFTSSMIPTIIVVFPCPPMMLSTIKVNLDANKIWISWLLCDL